MIKEISILYRKMQMYLNEKTMPFELSSGQFSFIMLIYHHPGINQNKIGELLNIDKSTVAKTLTKLEQDGFIKKTINPQDSRSFFIFPTQKTVEIHPKICKIGDEWKKTLTQGLSDIEADIFIQLLNKVTANAKKYFD